MISEVLDRAGQVEYVRSSALTVPDVWEKLLVDGWTIVADNVPELGFDPDFRQHVIDNFFNREGVLEPERYDVFPPDRMRARDTAVFAFADDGRLEDLQEHQSNSISTTDYYEGERHYRRTKLLEDNSVNSWLATLLHLVPPPVNDLMGDNQSHEMDLFWSKLLTDADETNGVYNTRDLRRLSGGGRGVIGVNLLQTYTDVVSGLHRDGSDYVSVSVVDKHGGGATSVLQREKSHEPVMVRTLKPGQTLIFDDRRFLHAATPLTPASDGTAYRSTIVSTFDYARGNITKTN